MKSKEKHNRDNKGRFSKSSFNPNVKSLKAAGLIHPNGVVLFSLMGMDYTCNLKQFINFIKHYDYQQFFKYCILLDGKARYRYDVKEGKCYSTENSKDGVKREVEVRGIPTSAKLIDVVAEYPNVFKKILDYEVENSIEMKKSLKPTKATPETPKQTKLGIDKNGHRYTRRVNIKQYEHTNATGGTIHPVTDKNAKKPVEATNKGNWYDKFKHLNLNKYPAGIPESEVTIDLTGDLDSHVIMTWKDSKGRKIYAYTGEFCKRNAKVKWARISKVNSKIIDSILTNSTKMMAEDPELTTPEGQSAAIIKIIANTGLRPGSIKHYNVTGNRGVSTLGPDSISIEGDTILFDFTGKSHKKNLSKIVDKDLAKGLKAIQKRKKEEKLDFLFDIDRAYVDNVFKNKMGYKQILLKDMRTYIATAVAKNVLYSDTSFAEKLTTNKAANKKLIVAKLNECDKVVARKLNNTPAMAKKSYIHPAIKQDWLISIGQKVEDFMKSFNYDDLSNSNADSGNIPTLDTIIKRSYFIGSYPNMNEEDEEYCDLYNTLPFEDELPDLFKSVDISDLKKEYESWTEGTEYYGKRENVKEFLENNHEDNMDLLDELCNSLKKASEPTKGKGCLMLKLDFPDINFVQSLIDVDDLLIIDPEDGRLLGFENDPHVTLLYGFTGVNDYGDIYPIFQKAASFRYNDIRIEGIGMFKKEYYDVLKFNVVNETLNKVNAELRKKFPYENSYSNYIPHLTIAYLKPGTAQKYVDKYKTASYILKPKYLIFSQKSKKANGEIEKLQMDWPINMDETPTQSPIYL